MRAKLGDQQELGVLPPSNKAGPGSEAPVKSCEAHSLWDVTRPRSNRSVVLIL